MVNVYESCLLADNLDERVQKLEDTVYTGFNGKLKAQLIFELLVVIYKPFFYRL